MFPEKSSFQNQHGITLIELLVGLVIVSFVITVGFLGLNQLNSSFKQTNGKLDIQNQTRDINELLLKHVKYEEYADVTLDETASNQCSFIANEFSNNNTLVKINSYALKYDFDGTKITQIKKVYSNQSEEILYEPLDNINNEYIKSVQTCLSYQNVGGLSGNETVFSATNTIATVINLNITMSSGLVKTFSTKVSRVNWANAVSKQVAFGGASSSSSTAFSKSITIDGTNDFTVPAQRVSTSTIGADATYYSYLSWDPNYVYLGFSGNDVANNDAQKWVIAYLNGSDGTVTGVKYQNQKAPTLAFKAKYQIQLNMSAGLFIIKEYNSSTNTIDREWTSKNNCTRDTLCTINTKDVSYYVNSTTKFIEIKLPRADMGLGPILKMNSYFFNNYSPYWSWGVVPGDNTQVNGQNLDIAFNTYLRADLSATSFATTAPVKDDVVSPSAPTNLASSSRTNTSITLSWTASTDNVAVTKYAVYRGGNLINDTITTNSFSDTGLISDSTYTYVVKALDAAGNSSSNSNVLSVSTTNSAGPAPTNAPNSLLTNANFETGNINNWTGWSNNGPSSVSVDSNDAYAGTYKAYFYRANAYKQSIAQTKSGLTNGFYEVTAWIKLSGTNPNVARMELSNYGADYGEKNVYQTFTNNGTWTQYKMIVKVTNGSLMVGFYVDSPGGTSLQIDNVNLVAMNNFTPGTTNYVTNPGFDDGNYDNWTAQSTNYIGVNAADKYSGTNKLYFYHSSAYSQGINQTISNLPNKIYEVKAWIKISNADATDARMEVSNYGGNPVYINTNSLTRDGTNSPVVYKSITIYTAVTNGQLNLKFSVNTNSNTSMQIDEISVK